MLGQLNLAASDHKTERLALGPYSCSSAIIFSKPSEDNMDEGTVIDTGAESHEDTEVNLNMEVSDETVVTEEGPDVTEDDDDIEKTTGDLIISSVVGGQTEVETSLTNSTDTNKFADDGFGTQQVLAASIQVGPDSPVEIRVKTEDVTLEWQTEEDRVDLPSEYQVQTPVKEEPVDMDSEEEQPEENHEKSSAEFSTLFESPMLRSILNKPLTVESQQHGSMPTDQTPSTDAHPVYMVTAKTNPQEKPEEAKSLPRRRRTAQTKSSSTNRECNAALFQKVKQRLGIEFAAIDNCLVCNAPCRITKNRKIPSLPFCKRCKKAYFYQLSLTHNGKRRLTPKCPTDGKCYIDYRVQGKLCPLCHLAKFQAVLKAEQDAFRKSHPENRDYQYDTRYQEPEVVKRYRWYKDPTPTRMRTHSRYRRRFRSSSFTRRSSSSSSSSSSTRQSNVEWTVENDPRLNHCEPRVLLDRLDETTLQEGVIVPKQEPVEVVSDTESAPGESHTGSSRATTLSWNLGGQYSLPPVQSVPTVPSYLSLDTGAPGNRRKPGPKSAKRRNSQKHEISELIPERQVEETIKSAIDDYLQNQTAGRINCVGTASTSHSKPRLLNAEEVTESKEAVKVFIFNCGHACSMCNSAAGKRWLQDNGYYTADPVCQPSPAPHTNPCAPDTATIMKKLDEINKMLQGSSGMTIDTNKNMLTVPPSLPAAASVTNPVRPVLFLNSTDVIDLCQVTQSPSTNVVTVSQAAQLSRTNLVNLTRASQPSTAKFVDISQVARPVPTVSLSASVAKAPVLHQQFTHVSRLQFPSAVSTCASSTAFSSMPVSCTTSSSSHSQPVSSSLRHIINPSLMQPGALANLPHITLSPTVAAGIPKIVGISPQGNVLLAPPTQSTSLSIQPSMTGISAPGQTQSVTQFLVFRPPKT